MLSLIFITALQCLSASSPLEILQTKSLRAVQREAKNHTQNTAEDSAIIAYALWRYGTAKEALKFFEQHPEIEIYLGGAYSAFMATLAYRIKDCNKGLIHGTKMKTESLWRPRVLWYEAQCWLKHKEATLELETAVQRLLQVAQNKKQSASAHLLLAQHHLRFGRKREALKSLKNTMLADPLSQSTRIAKQELPNGVARRFVNSPTWKLAEGEALLEKGRRRPAAQRFRAVKTHPRSTRDQRAEAIFSLAEILMVKQKYRQTIASIKATIESSKEIAQSTLGRGHYLLVDSFSRMARFKDAISFVELVAQKPELTGYDLATLYIGVRIALQKQNIESANRYAQKIRSSTQSGVEESVILSGDGARRSASLSHTDLSELEFELGWHAYQHNTPQKAIEIWQRIQRADLYFPAATFWIEKLSSPPKANIPSKFFEVAPVSIYGALSKEFQNINFDVLDEGIVSIGDDLRITTHLFSWGQAREAMRMVRRHPATALGPKDRLVVAWLYRKQQDIYRSALVAKRLDLLESSQITDPWWYRLAFPTPFEAEVQKWSRAFNVPQTLIYAVIRQESAFQPRATSPRYARGLMQMIPKTAKRFAKIAGLRRFRLKNLYSPNTSIQLGTLYLKTLLEEFDGNLVAVMASYHAGEHRVRAWLKTRPDLSEVEFLEDLPFATTRDYVKRVLTGMAYYQGQLGQAQAFSLRLDAAPQDNADDK